MGAMRFCRHLAFIALFTLSVLVCDCNRQHAPNVSRERNAQACDFGGIRGEQVSFYSEALQRRMRYLVLFPASYQSNLSRQYAVLFLLHGGGGGGHSEEWTQQSSVLQEMRGREWITVLPQADLSWYVNAALSPQDRYEDYIVHDLRLDVESHYRTRSDRSGRGIAGVSMGGYGAAFLTLKHPEIYSFAGLFGASLDAPRRWFNFIHVGQGIHESKTFGWWGHARDRYDPFVLLSQVESGRKLYIWSTCGDGDSFLPLARRFDGELNRAHIQHTFVVAEGGHEWRAWNSQLGAMLDAWSNWITR